MPNKIILDTETKRFIVISNPPRTKPPPVILTEEDKERVIKEFQDIFRRKPTQGEVEELFSEEVKIKRGN